MCKKAQKSLDIARQWPEMLRPNKNIVYTPDTTKACNRVLLRPLQLLHTNLLSCSESRIFKRSLSREAVCAVRHIPHGSEPLGRYIMGKRRWPRLEMAGTILGMTIKIPDKNAIHANITRAHEASYHQARLSRGEEHPIGIPWQYHADPVFRPCSPGDPPRRVLPSRRPPLRRRGSLKLSNKTHGKELCIGRDAHQAPRHSFLLDGGRAFVVFVGP